MKKLIVLFLIVLSYTSNVFSIEIYKIDSARVRVNNEFMKDCTILYVYQPWQKINGTIKINEKSNTIELSVINKIKYTINNKNIFTIKYDNIVLTSYSLENNLILLYKIYNSYYFYINDITNKIEIYYKINKIDI